MFILFTRFIGNMRLLYDLVAWDYCTICQFFKLAEKYIKQINYPYVLQSRKKYVWYKKYSHDKKQHSSSKINWNITFLTGKDKICIWYS